jgi:NTP pyrophosphatase (non-canonical NTP hydrolase)
MQALNYTYRKGDWVAFVPVNPKGVRMKRCYRGCRVIALYPENNPPAVRIQKGSEEIICRWIEIEPLVAHDQRRADAAREKVSGNCSQEHIRILNEVAEAVHTNAIEKGFHDFQESEAAFISRTCSNIHGEVSEFWEAHRNNKLNQYCDKSEKMMVLGYGALTNAEEELADIIIRALDTAKRLDINIGEAIVTKHGYNKTRDYRHGGKAA